MFKIMYAHVMCRLESNNKSCFIVHREGHSMGILSAVNSPELFEVYINYFLKTIFSRINFLTQMVLFLLAFNVSGLDTEQEDRRGRGSVTRKKRKSRPAVSVCASD